MASNLEVLNVRKYAEITKNANIKDIEGNNILLIKGEQVYFVNTVFSRPNDGFLITAAGIVLSTTKGYDLSVEEIMKTAKKAVLKLESGKEDELGLHFTL